jgi:hypothetical protein
MLPPPSRRHAGVLLGLLLNPEDGDGIFLQDIGCLSLEYVALHLKGQNTA